jgi:hypothetical protein
MPLNSDGDFISHKALCALQDCPSVILICDFFIKNSWSIAKNAWSFEKYSCSFA